MVDPFLELLKEFERERERERESWDKISRDAIFKLQIHVIRMRI